MSEPPPVCQSSSSISHAHYISHEELALSLNDAAWTSVLERWREQWLLCVRCGIGYVELDNIGRWRCKQHACPMNARTGVWPCCGARRTVDSYRWCTTGCVRADHIQPQRIAYTLAHTQVLPGRVKDLVAHRPEAVVAAEMVGEEEDGVHVYVTRFDYEATDERVRAYEKRKRKAYFT